MKPDSIIESGENPAAPVIFKIMSRTEWEGAVAAGCYSGSAADLRDGFIHLSATHQVHETWSKHFADQHDLVLVSVATAKAGNNLRWEPSRRGDLFPHLYGPLPMDAVVEVQDLKESLFASQVLRNSSSG
jgi:uncharacterized protein (DUF952 family)